MHESSKSLSMTPGIFASWFHLALRDSPCVVVRGIDEHDSYAKYDSYHSIQSKILRPRQQSCKPRTNVGGAMHESSKSLSMTPGIFASWFRLALGTVRMFAFDGIATKASDPFVRFLRAVDRVTPPATVVRSVEKGGRTNA